MKLKKLFSKIGFIFSLLLLVLILIPIRANASTNGHTQNDAVNWTKQRANEHWEINDGSGWTQCVEFVWAYYEYLVGYHVGGNAYEYLSDAKGACPSGWTRPNKSTAQPGDIVVWDEYAGIAGKNGHIGIIISVNGNTITTAEANAGYARGAVSVYTRDLSGVSGIIRPDFPNGNSPKICLDYAGCDVPGKVGVSGWAFDADNVNTAISVHVYAYVGNNSYFLGSTTANTSRPDVNDAYGCGNNHGFSGQFACPVSGSVRINVAAINIGSGQNVWATERTINVTADTSKPVISDVKVSNISNSGYTVTCKVQDNVGIKRVRFPSWTTANGQDDLIWHEGSVSNGVASCTIKTSDHGNSVNQEYITHIYAYDTAGNETCYTVPAIKVQDTVSKTKYRVAHYQENIDGTYKRVKLESFAAVTGKKVSPEVKSYSGFTSPSKKSATVKSDGSTIIKYYYTRNQYKLTWDLGGGKATGSYTKGKVYYGANITAPTSVKKTGYVFKGWSITVPKTMPAKNVTIKAKWEAKNQKEVQAFVTRFYKVFLNRKPEKEGLDYWTEALITKEMTGADVARGFVMSKEMNNRKLSNEEFVTLMYKGFFDRVPDSGGYSHWVGLLEAGYPREKVVAGFVNSQEFKNLCKKYKINPGSL